MKKIVLLCNQGMSTSALVKKMKEAADKLKYECSISAYSVVEAAEAGKDADIILIGPQIRYKLNEVKKALPKHIVEVIDMSDYGMMNGEKIIQKVRLSLEGEK